MMMNRDANVVSYLRQDPQNTLPWEMKRRVPRVMTKP